MTADFILIAAAACFAIEVLPLQSLRQGSSLKFLRPALVGVILQTWALYGSGSLTITFEEFNIGKFLAHFMGFAVLILFIVDAPRHFRFSWCLIPAVACATALSALLPLPSHNFPSANSPLVAHLILATLSYANFVVALAQFLDVRVAAVAVHSGRRPPGIPLLAMETKAFASLNFGFILLSLTLVTGALLSIHQGVDLTLLGQKNLFAILTWLSCAALLLGRRRFGWRGIIALRWVATSVLLLLVSYAGTTFLLYD